MGGFGGGGGFGQAATPAAAAAPVAATGKAAEAMAEGMYTPGCISINIYINLHSYFYIRVYTSS